MPSFWCIGLYLHFHNYCIEIILRFPLVYTFAFEIIVLKLFCGSHWSVPSLSLICPFQILSAHWIVPPFDYFLLYLWLFMSVLYTDIYNLSTIFSDNLFFLFILYLLFTIHSQSTQKNSEQIPSSDIWIHSLSYSYLSFNFLHSSNPKDIG